MPLYAQTRVALVSTCGGDAGQNVLALADAALSAETNIALVERREVERVLQEQKLMHCGLSQAQQAVTVGRLLGAQVFASLETVPNEKEALGLVVFDAGSGVVLGDSVLPTGSVQRAAATIATAVKLGCEKRQQPTGALTTVCILSVRNADLPRELDSLCQSVGSILQRQLVLSPSLAVLERRRLENVNKERLLPTESQLDQLLASLVIIDLEISRGGTAKGLSATATLSDNAGAKLGQATAVADSQNPADLSNWLIFELEKFLKIAPSQRVTDPAREAERFAREARFLADSREFEDGLKAAEAASALSPTNTAFQELLVECLGRCAGDRLSKGRNELNHSLDLAMRGLEICCALREQSIAHQGVVKWRGPELWLTGSYFWDRALMVANGQDADTTRKLTEFQRRCRELVVAVLDRRARAEVRDQSGFSDYTTRLSFQLLTDLERFAPSSDVWTADTLDCVRSWLKMAETFPLDPALNGNRILARLSHQAKGPWQVGVPGGMVPMKHVDNWTLQPPDYARLGELFGQMEGHRDPVIHAYGLAGHLSLELQLASKITAEVSGRYEAAKRFIRGEIGEPSRQPVNRYRILLYHAALDLIDLFPDAKTRQQEYEDWFEFMLGRKETEFWVTRMVTDPEIHMYHHYSPAGAGAYMEIFPTNPDSSMVRDKTRLIHNAERVLSLFRSGECRDLDASSSSHNTGSFERELAWIQRNIRSEAASSENVPWAEARLLLDVSRPLTNSSIAGVAFDPNVVYAALLGGGLELARVPLDGGQVTFLGTTPYHGYKADIVAIGDGVVFVGTINGIFMFRMDGGPVRRIGTEEGLPSENVQALAWLDGKLYAALGAEEKEAFIVSYDLRASTCDVLISSRRKEARSGLDNLSPPPLVTSMIADAGRHRVLFTVHFGPNIDCVPALGLWQIDTTTAEVKQVVRLYSEPLWAGSMDDDTLLVSFYDFAGRRPSDWCGAADCGVVSLNLATDQVRVLYACGQGLAGPGLPVPEKLPRMPMSVRPPLMILEGWLWFAERGQAGRVSAGSGLLEYFPAHAAGTSYPQGAFKSFHSLGNTRQLIAAERQKLWLLKLRDPPSKDKP